jgi:formaldehyde-activating enzyme involved in methanogenesis
MTKKSERKVDEASGADASGNKGLTPEVIQDAMAQAVADAQAEGVTDPKEIKKRMLDARKSVKD